MLEKIISATGFKVSALGLGCMGMSEFYGATSDEESTRVLVSAVEQGITHFDTADIYGFGTNEILVGKALKPYRNKVKLATKCGIVRDKNDPAVRNLNGKPEYVKSACEASLKRLGVEIIDLYYLHRLDPHTPIEETILAMSDLTKEGKIRFVGLSEVNEEIIRRAHLVHPITAIQSEYSLWNRGPETAIFPVCRELGIGFVAYSPLGRGFLTGKIKSSTDLEAKDFRHYLPRFQKENFEHNLCIVQQLERIARVKHCTAAQLALAWVLAQGNYITAIPGTKREKYLKENLQSLNIQLSQEEIASLNQAPPAKGERYSPEAMRVYQLKE